jgi:hypothetical protein
MTAISFDFKHVSTMIKKGLVRAVSKNEYKAGKKTLTLEFEFPAKYWKIQKGDKSVTVTAAIDPVKLKKMQRIEEKKEKEEQ